MLFREVNDRIREVTDHFGVTGTVDFICECSQEDCTDTIELEPGEYEAVRSSPRLFVITPGHESLQVERVVKTNERFALVEKMHAVELVIQSDPRAQSRRGSGGNGNE